MRSPLSPASVSSLLIPPTSELFSKDAMVERHPNLLNPARIQWALRNRSGVVYEWKSGQLSVHEPEFLRWYLGLTVRAKPRSSRVAREKEYAIPVQLDSKLSRGLKH